MPKVNHEQMDPFVELIEGNRQACPIGTEECSSQFVILFRVAVVKAIDNEAARKLIRARPNNGLLKVVDMRDLMRWSHEHIWVDEISVQQTIIRKLDVLQVDRIMTNEFCLFL